jgi:hypothetical protein
MRLYAEIKAFTFFIETALFAKKNPSTKARKEEVKRGI